ncbi:MAG: hypothetical protein COU46_02190 [Candidatus Niyogibacteria bacterium CG10_big_fil_rev_8_21_14_0_10_42_19]|uniref:Carboxypeptidase regulatory-like domain-containing protein n=1 Tax=Candidatus Niyogibacteria bacterium CG10_big_fil_rev_8_21_14_0_10_42_19 TaxID=1974725 RepID=A0A2H0TFI2_9BACT|nr:MAG: hypothetical protein COU46_02190 [Candidatus Niyogibacteria bacterium CG10_big_fil_rev_8_21_14_0_10_42_19]
MTKLNTSTMFSAGKIIIGVLCVVVIIGFVLGVYGFLRGLENPPKFDDTKITSPEAAEFSEKIQNYVVENIGQPIEGFNADIYLRAFPGLFEADFDGVETWEGEYAYANGKLTFERTKAQPITSAEEAISKEGHQTLFENAHGRLGIKLSVDEVVYGIIAQGLGKVTGTILLGPTCPVVKDPPDLKCADKPIFGEFIVQNVMGSVEFTRFGTARDGSFEVTLPVGEYYITWAESQGLPGAQGQLVNVIAGETSEYTIIFDTGIR